MKKTTIALLGLCCVLSADAADIRVSKSVDQTSKSVPLDLKIELATVNDGRVKIQGTVKNTGNQKLRYVKVFMTFKDAYNAFVTREWTFTEPTEVGQGQVAYVELSFTAKDKTPSSMEYSVTADQ